MRCFFSLAILILIGCGQSENRPMVTVDPQEMGVSGAARTGGEAISEWRKAGGTVIHRQDGTTKTMDLFFRQEWQAKDIIDDRLVGSVTNRIDPVFAPKYTVVLIGSDGYPLGESHCDGPERTVAVNEVVQLEFPIPSTVDRSKLSMPWVLMREYTSALKR